MSKAQLQTNNTKYSQLIGLLRGKAVGGGGSLETVTLTISSDISGPSLPGEDVVTYYIYYTNENGVNCVDHVDSLTFGQTKQYTVVKNTLILIVIPSWIYYSGSKLCGLYDEFSVLGGDYYNWTNTFYSNQFCNIGFIKEDMLIPMHIGM